MLGRSLGKYVVKERKIEMAEKKNLLTREGLRKLEDELQDLKVNRRQEIAQKIKEAREQGDLSFVVFLILVSTFSFLPREVPLVFVVKLV